MMSIKSRILLACAASLLTLSACNADEPAKPVSKEGAAAIVNGARSPRAASICWPSSAPAWASRNLRKCARRSSTNWCCNLVAQEALKKGLDEAEVQERVRPDRENILANAFVPTTSRTPRSATTN